MDLNIYRFTKGLGYTQLQEIVVKFNVEFSGKLFFIDFRGKAHIVGQLSGLFQKFLPISMWKLKKNNPEYFASVGVSLCLCLTLNTALKQSFTLVHRNTVNDL